MNPPLFNGSESSFVVSKNPAVVVDAVVGDVDMFDDVGGVPLEPGALVASAFFPVATSSEEC